MLSFSCVEDELMANIYMEISKIGRNLSSEGRRSVE